jgi:hypothetical protein
MIGGVFVGLVFAAAAALALQLANAVSAVVDAASVRDSDEPDSVTRTRLRELIWTLAVLAAVAVFIAFGIDWAARLVWEDDQPAWGLGVLVLTATAAFLAGSVGVVAILRRERPTYARLRRDLRDRSTFSVTPDELADFESRLERADEIRRRRPRASLALKVIGLVLVVGVGGVAATALLVTGSLDALFYLGGVVVHVVAFVVALRAGAVHRARLDAVLEAQRDEVVAMLERARIPQRGSVPGLRDRVARALAILREKQR